MNRVSETFETITTGLDYSRLVATTQAAPKPSRCDRRASGAHRIRPIAAHAEGSPRALLFSHVSHMEPGHAP